MKLIVGLGNTGAEYEATRHNVGFRVLDRLAEQHDVTLKHRSFEARYGDSQLGGEAVRFLRPHTMMNRSGVAVQAAVQEWHVPLQDVLLVCDDVNVPLGALRLRAGGSAGGQHGLGSCLEALGTEDVPRLRCGVGVTPLPKDLTEFVLSPFDRKELPIAQEMIARAAEACEQWCREGIDATMNRVNAS